MKDIQKAWRLWELFKTYKKYFAVAIAILDTM
jgi:hypothetical protein